MEEMGTQPKAPSGSSSSIHQSAKMRDAQSAFQRAVKKELEVLLVSGMDRGTAVKQLLHRIVESTEEPDQVQVQHVMKQFQMHHDDAVRALIVKQEIGRLKRKGMNAFDAIEELTRKMQRAEQCRRASDNGNSTVSPDETDGMNPVEDVSNASDSNIQAENEVSVVVDGKSVSIDVAEDQRSEPDEKASLSLCERIGEVSISSNQSKSEEVCPTPSISRKRRSPYDSGRNSRDDPGDTHANDPAVVSPFASSKRQKLCIEIEKNLLCMVSNSKGPSVSPQSAASRANLNLLKRQRPTARPSSPSSEGDLIESSPVIRHVKRHRT